MFYRIALPARSLLNVQITGLSGGDAFSLACCMHYYRGSVSLEELRRRRMFCDFTLKFTRFFSFLPSFSHSLPPPNWTRVTSACPSPLALLPLFRQNSGVSSLWPSHDRFYSGLFRRRPKFGIAGESRNLGRRRRDDPASKIKCDDG